MPQYTKAVLSFWRVDRARYVGVQVFSSDERKEEFSSLFIFREHLLIINYLCLNMTKMHLQAPNDKRSLITSHWLYLLLIRTWMRRRSSRSQSMSWMLVLTIELMEELLHLEKVTWMKYELWLPLHMPYSGIWGLKCNTWELLYISKLPGYMILIKFFIFYVL